MIVCATCILLFAQAAQAQEQETSAESTITTKVGVKGGVNLTNLYVDNVEDENMKLGLNVGLFAKVPVFRGLSIQPELLYSGKGAKVTYDNFLLGTGEYRFNLHYIEVPVSLVINIARNFNLHAGVYASYLAAANITDLEDDGTVNTIKELDADDFNRFDYGLLGGVALDVQNFTIGARYNYGLREIADTNATQLALGDAKNSALSLYVGFGF